MCRRSMSNSWEDMSMKLDSIQRQLDRKRQSIARVKRQETKALLRRQHEALRLPATVGGSHGTAQE